MKTVHVEISVALIRDKISERLKPMLEARRRYVSSEHMMDLSLDLPVSDAELERFIGDIPFYIAGEEAATLLGDDNNASSIIEVPDNEFVVFYSQIEGWLDALNMLGGGQPKYDDYGLAEPKKLKEERYSGETLAKRDIYEGLAYYSPSLSVLNHLLKNGIDLDSLHWRELEVLIKELLVKDGYDVQLGSGSKDKGVDLIAVNNIPQVGPIKTIWQAKHYPSGRKVGLSVIRELSDVRNEFGATKGIIVTTSFLTKGAIDRIKKDEYILGKIERSDLEQWILRVLQGRIRKK